MIEAFQRETIGLACGLPVEEVAHALAVKAHERGLMQERSSRRPAFAQAHFLSARHGFGLPDQTDDSHLSCGTKRKPGRRTEYTTEVIGNVICLVDLDKAVSITNDADHVIRDLHQRFGGLSDFRVIYLDAMGTWDEIAIVENRFYGFKSVNERSQAAALGKVSQQASEEAPLPQDSYRTG